MIRYDLKAYKTMLNGVEYRTRLEARWAALFTVMKWRFDYEPLDLGKWSPDFVLHGADAPILVEVKPIDRLDRDVCRQMTDAANETDFEGTLLLLGLNPLCPGTNGTTSREWLGWVHERLLWSPAGHLEWAPFDPSEFHPCGAMLLNDGVLDFGTVDSTRVERRIAHAEEMLGRPLSPKARADAMADQWKAHGHMMFEEGGLQDYATVKHILDRNWSRACNLVKWRP
jgi:hypothetical protein